MSTRSEAATEQVPRGRSTRNRILGWYLLLLAIALFAALLLQRSYLLATVNSQIEGDLRQEVAEFNQVVQNVDAAAQADPTVDAGVETIFETFLENAVPSPGEGVITFTSDNTPFLADTAGTILNNAAMAAAIDGIDEPQRGEISTTAGPARYLAVPLRATDEASGEMVTAGVFVIAVFLDERLGTVDQAFRTGAAMVLLVFVLVSAVAWLVAGRILQPLRQLTGTAAEISDTDLSQRIPVQGKDELATLAATFNSMLDRLEQAFTTQRRFIDDAGHELRTPITIIRGHLELLGDDPVERQQTVEVVTAELDRMARIVDDLLMLARAEQPDFVVTAPVDVEDFIADLKSRAWALAPQHHWHLDESVPAVVEADAQRLTQAMVNLIRNVGIHTPPGTSAGVGAAIREDGLHLWVRDEGPGIPDEDLDHVFERFRRGSRTRRGETGAGLGLSIVAAIAEGHGGQIQLDSGEGGTTFTLVLPYSAERDLASLILPAAV